MFTSSFLTEVRRKALRRRVWYGALDRVERGILSLAAQVVDRVESVVLGVELVKIIGKLNDAMRSRFTRCRDEFGFRRARIVAGQALSFGYEMAAGWAFDLDFIRYVTFIRVNTVLGWEV
jgi:hypothetical protein